MKNMMKLTLSALMIASMLLVGCFSAFAEEEEVVPAGLGVVEGSTYYNEYAGFGCELPESFVMLPADQLQQLPENVGELLGDTELGQSTDFAAQITDMMAQDPTTGSSVNVLLQPIDPAQRIAMMLMDDDALMDATLAQSDAMVSAYEAAGMTVTEMDKYPLVFTGDERIGMKTVCTVNGAEIVIIQVFDFNLGGKYSVTTTFSAATEEDALALADMFYAL